MQVPILSSHERFRFEINFIFHIYSTSFKTIITFLNFPLGLSLLELTPHIICLFMKSIMKISKLYVPMLESHMFLQNHKNIINETIHLGVFTLKEGGIFFHLECFVFIILFYLSIEKKQLISSYTRSLLDLLCPTASRSRISSMKATMKYWNCIFQLWYQSQMSWTTYRKITPSLILKTNVCRWFPSGLLKRLVFNRMKPNNVSIVKRCPMKVLAPSLRSSANFLFLRFWTLYI